MNSKFAVLKLVCMVLLFLGGCAQQDTFPVLSGEYLGQKPPGLKGELFAPGVMSTSLPELNSVFFPGGKEVIYSIHVGDMKWAMLMMREENGRWSKPEVAPFSGEYGGVDPFVSFDGKTVYFCSNRPRSGGNKPEEDYDIWSVERTSDGWSEPVNMGPPINSEAHEFYPSLTRDGTMYFQSRREGGFGDSDIYRAGLVDGRYRNAELLPAQINSPGSEGDAFIAPDEGYLIVSTWREEENIGRSDLYISFRNEDGTWSPLQNMGEQVNSSGGENCQILSPCGRYLFYTSRQYKALPSDPPLTYDFIRRAWATPQNGFGDIYWIDAKIIDGLKSESPR
ncbi:MAG: PD40 domain-containing protein [Gemmatimonadota bacterium]|nr:MAG: PD40 domain-containing protein [Gemmatimonadota bacterium]